MSAPAGLLVAFSGLPGTGKTTIARLLARELHATYLRIDDIEHAIRSAGLAPGPAGYLVGYALAEANLGPGRTVVADNVNPLQMTRDAWRRAAERAGARLLTVLVVCSDAAEHRRRVERRLAAPERDGLPSWADILDRPLEPWDRTPLTLDTAALAPPDAVAAIRHAIGATDPSPGSRAALTAGGQQATASGLTRWAIRKRTASSSYPSVTRGAQNTATVTVASG